MAKKEDQISIDGVTYALDSLSEEAQAQLINIQFVDDQLQQLRNEFAVADTAKMGYTNALKAEISQKDTVDNG